jgi:hypothetical protein
MTNTSCELVWMKYLLNELDVHHDGLMRLQCDNQATKHITKNQEWIKYIMVDCHLIRDLIIETSIYPPYIQLIYFRTYLKFANLRSISYLDLRLVV